MPRRRMSTTLRPEKREQRPQRSQRSLFRRSATDPLADWPAFVEHAGRRLQAGRRTYRDRSFSRPLQELVGEVEEELLDVAGWAYILWRRVHTLRGKVGTA